MIASACEAMLCLLLYRVCGLDKARLKEFDSALLHLDQSLWQWRHRMRLPRLQNLHVAQKIDGVVIFGAKDDGRCRIRFCCDKARRS